MPLTTADFDFELPEGFIAQRPMDPRDASRLMRVRRKNGSITHHSFIDLPMLLQPGDLLVCNDTKVFPARLQGEKAGSGIALEVFLVAPTADVWQVLIRPGKRAPVGTVIHFSDGLEGIVEAVRGDGTYTIRFNQTGTRFRATLDRIGSMPTPPYVATLDESDAREQYQTMYARTEGSVAAPTAGFHFTPRVFEALTRRGIERAFVTLHVGLGTFLPVQAESVADHVMHAERYTVSPETAAMITAARQAGRRIVAVGTTTTRVLESCMQSDGTLRSGSGETSIFITPGYRFTCVDALITNFHLPRSTLLMLVSAFADRELILHAYEAAKQNNYRFYSFGDAMLIE